jgi:hypothetical protein
MKVPEFLLRTSKGQDREWMDHQPISVRSLSLINDLDSQVNNVLLHEKTHIQKPDDEDEEMSKEYVEAQIETIQLHATDGVQDLFSNQSLAYKKYVLHWLNLGADLGLASLEHFRDNYLDDYFSHLIDRKRKTFEVFTSFQQLEIKYGKNTPMFNFWWDIHKQYGKNIEKTEKHRTNKTLKNLMDYGKRKAEKELLEVKIRTKAVIECPHTSQALELHKIPRENRIDSFQDVMGKCQYAIIRYAQFAVDEWNRQLREEKKAKKCGAVNDIDDSDVELTGGKESGNNDVELTGGKESGNNDVELAGGKESGNNDVELAGGKESGNNDGDVAPVVKAVGSVDSDVAPVVKAVGGSVVTPAVVKAVDNEVIATAIPVAEIVGCIVQASAVAAAAAETTTKGMFELLMIC